MPGDDDDGEVRVETAEGIRDLLLRELYRQIGADEKRAAETGQVVDGTFCFARESDDGKPAGRPILAISYRCEPGKAGEITRVERGDP